MKPTIFLINFLIIAKNIFAQEDYNSECSYINELIGQDYSYDCCNYNGITCENNHITKMYIFKLKKKYKYIYIY